MPKPSEICISCISARQLQRFFDFIMGDDLDFYEEYTVNLTEEERERFFRDNPDFMLEVGERYDKMGFMKYWIYWDSEEN